jgi:hypothetical protein
MDKVKRPAPIRPLPGRGALNDIAKSPMTINDYAKAVPTNPITPNPAEIRMLGARKPQ